MHPHWHSASPEVQHRLVSLYLLSLASASPNEPTSPTSPAVFESELYYTRSSHDIAAVLRWGLRHLKLDGDSFGKESGDWTWYNTFAAAERADSYPPDAFSKFLIPQLPTTHGQLLLTTLDIISSLSARSEANGSSGSKLSKLFGLWLLTSEPAAEGDDWIAFYDRWDRAGRILEHLFLARIRNDAQRLPRRLTDLVEHYPYNSGVDAPKDDLLPPPRFSTRQYDALLVRLDTEYSGPSKPKSHPLRLIADALRAQSTSEAAITEDDDVWNAIKKASLTFDAPEVSTDAALAEPIPIFSNIFSDESVRLLSLIPLDVSDKDKSAPTFALQSPISPGRPRSFSLPETPLSPDQADGGRSSQSGHPHVAPGLTVNISTAPTTSIPVTPTDWSRFSNQGFGTIPGSRDLVATLWDNDVEVTVPPPAPLSRKSSRRARSRHSSVDSARTPLPPPPAVPAPPISKTTLVTKVKLDEAFIDFWADSLLDPVSKRWPRFVLCQLKSLPFAATSSTPTTPTPAWLIIEQRFLRLAPVSLVKEEAEPTVPPARPRPSSPRPESSRLSAAFSIASKKRFAFFTGGSSDPKSPKEKSARLPQLGEFGEGMNGTGNGAATATPAEKSQETSAKVGEGATLAAATVSTTAVAAVGAAAATVAATREEITQTPKEDGLPTRTVETAPSESAPKADEPVKGEPPHGIPTQNGVARDHHDDEQREREPEMTAAEGPAGADAAVIPPVTKEPVKSEAELPIPEADTETAQREPASVPASSDSAGVGEGAIAQVEAAPAEPGPVPRESGPVVEPSSPGPSAVPVVEEAMPAGEKDAPTSAPPTSASAPTTELTTVPAESAPVQALPRSLCCCY
ncbi:hypothetical protein BC826DRAFT_139701 [Russula brevipes]|nr:hypothetical protein BC826DRAFT_139701 [Russula brevipes]